MSRFATFFRANVADELHLAAPVIECIQDAVGVPGGGISQNVLECTLLSAQTSYTVLPYPNQDGPIEQHKEVAVLDYQRQQEGDKGESNGRGHHP